METNNGIDLIQYEKSLKQSFVSKGNLDELVKEEIDNVIRKTDTYKRSVEEYNNYIERLASFIKNNLGITDNVIISSLVRNMLEKGMLSYNSSQHEYALEELNQYVIYEITELLGLCISTGKSVCRHRAAFETDLQNLIGNFSYFALNYSFIKSSENHYKIDGACNHVAVLTKNEKGIFISDTTNNFQVNRVQHIEGKDNKHDYLYYRSPSNKIVFFMPLQLIYDYHLVKRKEMNRTLLEEERGQINQILLLANQYHNTQKFQERLKVVDDTIFTEYWSEVEQFHNDTNKQLRKMKRLYETIVPITKKRINKHIIK